MSVFINVKPRDLLTADHVTPRFTPGKAFYQDKETGALWRYGKVTTGTTHANTPIAGRPLYWDVKASGTMKTDDDGTEKEPAGVLPGTKTTGRFCWVQFRGRCQTLVTNAATINTPLVADSANGCLKVAGGAEAASVWGENVEAGKNPATPLTTLCELRLPE